MFINKIIYKSYNISENYLYDYINQNELNFYLVNRINDIIQNNKITNLYEYRFNILINYIEIDLKYILSYKEIYQLLYYYLCKIFVEIFDNKYNFLKIEYIETYFNSLLKFGKNLYIKKKEYINILLLVLINEFKYNIHFNLNKFEIFIDLLLLSNSRTDVVISFSDFINKFVNGTVLSCTVHNISSISSISSLSSSIIL